MSRETLTAAVEAFDLTKTLPLGRETIAILNGVSFSIARGEWVTLMGPSGSGKSTLLGIIAGLDSPTTGQIHIDGVDITTMRERELARIRNEKIGVVFQSFNLIPTLTAQENVEAPLYVSARRGNVGKRAQDMLDLVGLRDRRHHHPYQLSGGQQQRVAIARALIGSPTLLVADEPTGNLDSKTGGEMLDLFARLRQELGLTLIIATHDPAVAARADRGLYMVDGLLNSAITNHLSAPSAAAIPSNGATSYLPMAADKVAIR